MIMCRDHETTMIAYQLLSIDLFVYTYCNMDETIYLWGLHKSHNITMILWFFNNILV